MRLRGTAKPSSGPSVNVDSLCRNSTTASSFQMIVAQDSSPAQTMFSVYSKPSSGPDAENKHAEFLVAVAAIGGASPSVPSISAHVMCLSFFFPLRQLLSGQVSRTKSCRILLFVDSHLILGVFLLELEFSACMVMKSASHEGFEFFISNGFTLISSFCYLTLVMSSSRWHWL